MPKIPSPADYQAATQERAWPHPVPSPPNETAARAELKAKCLERAKREEKVSIAKILAGVLALMATAGVAFETKSLCVSVFGLFVSYLLIAPDLGNWRRRPLVAERYFTNEWQSHWANVQARWSAHKEWPNTERDRTEFATRLNAGNLDALEESLSDSLSDLDFPFDASCRVAIESPHEAFILMDLPEIEDAIAEEKQRALKSGELKDVRRSKQERQTEYAHLTAGLALWVVRTVFAAGPTLRKVHVAAYTQRRRARTGELVDEYVYEVEFDRETAATWVAETVDPISVIRGSSRSRIDLRADGQLKALTPPSWLDRAG